MQNFDLIAIGGGTAGLVTAAGAASLGLRSALVEREALGGDCLWTGCVPSKAMIASARLAHRMRDAESLGLTGAAPAHVFGDVMGHMRAARDRVAHHDDPQRFRDMGVDVRFGEARVTGPREVLVDGARLSAKRIVIATGATPTIPNIPGLEGVDFLTHVNVFDLEHLPRSLVVIGGGPVGLEFAQVFARLGSQVTLVEAEERIAGAEEPEAAELIGQALDRDGIRVAVNHLVCRVVEQDGIRTTECTAPSGIDEMLQSDQVLVATGRSPNTAGLGLEEVGVRLQRGGVQVDAGLRSNVKSIWAAGDVTGAPQFTPVADYQAKLVLRNSVFPFSSRARYDQIPMVTFTDPEIARIGLTEQQARDIYGDDVAVYRYGLDDLDRAIVDGRAEGFVKVVTGKRARILGATIVASGAGDLLQPFVIAMKNNMPLPKLAQVVYPYPTMVEGVKRVADAYYREKFAGNTGRWLRRIVRLLA